MRVFCSSLTCEQTDSRVVSYLLLSHRVAAEAGQVMPALLRRGEVTHALWMRVNATDAPLVDVAAHPVSMRRYEPQYNNFVVEIDWNSLYPLAQKKNRPQCYHRHKEENMRGDRIS